jgi:PAS domain S-box-containing protein
MVYANYCFGFLNNPKLGTVYLDRTRHLNPAFDIRFYLYKKDSEIQQQIQSESLGGEALNLVSYIEFQRNFKLARKFHTKAAQSIRAFWSSLLHEDMDINLLTQAFKRIDMAESKAQEHYNALLVKYPNSVRILRSYAQFQEEVLSNPVAADQLYMRADALEDKRDTSKDTSDQTSESGSSTGGRFITSHTKVGKSDFMVLMDIDSTIVDVNANCHLFGYKPHELIGKSILELIPEPYKSKHDQFVYNHVTTGVTKIIGVGNRRLPVVQKDGSLASIMLSVTKVSMGSKVLFVGLIKKSKVFEF